jgi:AcrR family transcriptional regulator
MSEVVAAAGCGRNLLYGQFPSKDDLVAAYLDRFRAARDQAADDALRRAGDDPAAQLVALVGEVADRIREPYFRGCPFRNHLTEGTDHESAPARVALDYLTDGRARIDRLAEALGVPDPVGLADRVWLVLDGLYAGAARREGERSGVTAVAMVRESIDRASADRREPV